MSQLFLNASLIRFSVETVHILAYLAPPPPPPLLAFEEPCFLTFTFNPIHYCAPPPVRYTQLSGETKALPNMDAFLFPWICAALPWGYCTPPSPPSPPTHTHTLAPSTSPPFRRGEKYLGLFIVSPLPWVEMAFRKDGTERSHSGGHILLRVMLIECRKVAELKGKWRSKGRY